MRIFTKKNLLVGIGLISLVFIKNHIVKDSFSSGNENDRVLQSSQIKEKIGKSILSAVELPSKIRIDDENFKVNYHIDTRLENFVQNQIKQYHPDFASVVVIDNDNGKILTAIDYSRQTNNFSRTLTFSNTHPAASVFKIITAAELLKNHKVSRDSLFAFNGRSTTLYKNQILRPSNRRWTRHQTFGDAFAKSNNVVFGKAGVNLTNPNSLVETAHSFGFNEQLMEEVNMIPSTLGVPETQFNMAELSSGFNTETMMSPMHGAVIASIIANDGILKTPSIVSNVVREKNEELVWFPRQVMKNVLSHNVSTDLQELMEMTIDKGTARSAFRRAKGYPFSHLDIGGKTGSITGGFPYGKRDWFVSYAKPKDKFLGKGLSICVMIVNQKKWYVKSTQVAKNVIEHYYKNLNPLKKFQKITQN